MSEWMQEWWFGTLLILVVMGYGFSEAKKRSKEFNNFIDRTTLKLPVAGDIVYKATIARFARTLATTFAAGVPLVDALDSVSGATGNVVYRNAVNKIKEEVSPPEPIIKTPQETPIEDQFEEFTEIDTLKQLTGQIIEIENNKLFKIRKQCKDSKWQTR